MLQKLTSIRFFTKIGCGNQQIPINIFFLQVTTKIYFESANSMN